MPEKSQSMAHDVPMGEESPRLSIASLGSNDRSSITTLSDCSDFTDVQRPVSVVSNISSGSGSSRDDVPLSGVVSAAVPIEDNVDLELTPAANPTEPNLTQTSSHFLQQNSSNTVNNNTSFSPFAANTMAPNPELTYLDRVVMEIIETERMYVRDLRSIVEDYLAHIIDTGDLPIKPEQVCALFGNIEDIYEFNSELLQSLDMCDSDPVAIARCFVIKSEYFDIYTQYCTNYPNSVAALTDCMRNKTLAKFFRERQATLKRSLPLGSYLLKPVQRILKYHLLLQEIAKHFDPQENGYEVVEEAIYTMTGVAWYINDMKRKHEHAVRLQEVQSLLINWKGPDLTTYGELVLEGSFRIHRAKNERTLFLFDRMLLITKRRGEHYVYKTHISCSTLMLIESAKDSLCFSVTHYKHPKQPHTVQARTLEEKKLWAHHIKRLIIENHQAVIPQKAKEAILEMDSIYKKYRYSPERLKKSVSCQSEEFSNFRQGLKQPASKEALKSTKAMQKEEEGCAFPENTFKKENKPSAEQVKACLKDEKCIFEQDKSQHLKMTSCWGTTDKTKEDTFCDPEPIDVHQHVLDIREMESAIDQDDLKGPKKEREARKSFLHQNDTPGESSEDEEDTEEKPGSTSILPSSVLDQASAIAEHFVCTARRISISTDDARSPGCPSPHLPSRTGSTLSLRDPLEHQHRLTSTYSDSCESPLTQENLASVDFTIGSSVEDGLFDCDRSICRRRDSVLSTQDQLLISKIRSYYENAEHQDATFSLKRRESLSYIPSGLVRNSVSRLNSIPKDKGLALETTVRTFEPDKDCASSMQSLFDTTALSEATSSANSSRQEQPVVSASTNPTGFNVDGSVKPQSTYIQAESEQNEVFHPSSEMIKVWQDMEREVTRCQGDVKALVPRGNPYFRGICPNLIRRDPNQDEKTEAKGNKGLIAFEDSDLSTIKEESFTPSPLIEKENSEAISRNDAIRQKQWQKEGRLLSALAPRVIQLRAESEYERGTGAQSAEDGDSAQSKVLNLARKYSQRIKCTQPMLRQRSQESGETGLTKRNMLSVVDEKPEEVKGKPDSMPSMAPYDQADRDRDQEAQLMPLSPARSPTPPEKFNWPDVRELRSKYAHLDNPSSQPAVAQNQSAADRMFDRSSTRRSSCSSSHLITSNGSSDCSFQTVYNGKNTEQFPTRTQRAGSLDQKLGSLYLRDLHILQSTDASSGYYVSAQATLPNEKNIIVIEKVPEVPPAVEIDLSTKEGKKPELMDDDGYVQIRSPTSHEKISIKAVIDRCRAYQDSEEYRLREEGGCKTEKLPKTECCKKVEKASSCSEPSDDAVASGKKADSSQHSVVKNLRDKFQNIR
nr:pleckstrin homology domain-containing family G member 3 isoform X5 [Danio rerio]|eukprot:XP_017208172.1 pleckstrin homology domain-containing family G member 3 isoform X5 [Danio rerio]